MTISAWRNFLKEYMYDNKNSSKEKMVIRMDEKFLKNIKMIILFKEKA